jgi:hypothetical protein
MQGRSLIALTLLLALATGAFILLALSPQIGAQPSCTEIRGISQATLPTSYPLAPDADVWGGPIYTTVGGEPLVGGMSGNDGSGSQHGAKGGQYQVYLCSTELLPANFTLPPACQDSFTFQVANSVFGFTPGKVGLGDYKGNTAKIISGTGRFAGASGNLNIAGPYILWSDSASPFGVSGRWNSELSGSICGIR